MDSVFLDALGLKEFPDRDIVMPVINGKNIGKWIYRAIHLYKSGSISMGWVDTEEDGWAQVANCHEFTRKFWDEKISWHKNGDKSPQSNRRNVIRLGHQHMAVSTFGINKDPSAVLGFGGHVFRWRFLDDSEGTIHESNNVYSRGHQLDVVWQLVPQRFWDGSF